MRNNIIKVAMVAVMAVSAVACTKDLDRQPFYDVTSASVYNDFANYKQILAKVYAGLAVSGQQGPSGRPDISGIDEGFSTYLRQYFQLQELTTDEAVIGWNDGTIQDLHRMNWTPTNEFITAMYNRFYYQISLANEYIRELSDANLATRNISGTNLEEAKRYRAEARFMRALSYYHAMDMFGNIPFVTDADKVGSFFPQQQNRAFIFDYIEKELLEIESELADAKSNEYGRADKAAAWMLLSKLYLNAPVYKAGTEKYTEAITYASKVINAGFQLEPQYKNLFLADNHNSQEIIFPVVFDGLKTRTWGGMTYLVHAAVGGNMNPAQFGINGGWGGLRTTKNIVNLFPDPNGSADKRGQFHTNGQNLEITDIGTFTEGYAVTKYRNVTSTGAAGSDQEGNHPDTDFPMFRLADAYLIYAEAVLRGGSGGSVTQALDYVNDLRERAYGNTNGNIVQGQLTLDFILDERARELHWEMQRRTDLIRFGKYTGSNYIWPWKGGVQAGRAVEDFRVLFPIPSSDLAANPNLTQNQGY